ncbi:MULTISPECIES: Y-family DNA polymerase [unclassified Prochlorococcus]|uniref:Y-family DNA polymerase n=1 Tax=unclassified Prochlorococcus TaxID=2627481 RepID=UPI0005338177|nr:MULTISPECIES: Y-family DNA polymerase [unclassified Prochlorococcus]KGG15072.1 Error-prone [Prochlorococcus sp. MIT 0602]KGG17344.1 Error-prone [Prochlorococcus sp. MIT 0603]
MPIALIDSNNFYTSCEQSLDPSLIDRPLIVLSNNDSCVIACNAQAKALGISRGEVYFKIHRKVKELGIQVRSSNYALYADMSQRLMQTIEANCEELEVYSIDEAFAKINYSIDHELHSWARRLREITYQRLGLAIAIGIGATKSQAKLANYLAKTTTSHAGVFDLKSTKDQDHWYQQIAIENIWGIGHKFAYWCRMNGIRNAKHFRDMSSNKLKKKLGITGLRLQHELHGKQCLHLSVKAKPKQETCVSKSFKYPISNIEELRQAIASYTIRASEKLRAQKQHATAITIFTRTSFYTPIFYSQSATQRLTIASSDTRVLLQAALNLTAEIFRPNHLLVKAGVIMQGLLNEEYLQLHLLPEEKHTQIAATESLMETIDNLNKRYGRNTVTWAICGINQNWEMSRKYLSAAATTCLKEIPIVKT